jgi:ABC-type uncharacterized transport system permease subunit
MDSQTREGSEGQRCKAVLASLGGAAQQVAGADPLIEHRFAAGLGFVSCLRLMSASFHPWAAQLRPLGGE